ncbi:hypothetical protein [Streptomyces sp. NPDC094032]|uniref:hypothetical protein n=1 Tax=Streptomyces sp. NPDC094032 TaxID=3155308 RepID=UPI0033177F9A
MSPRTPLPPPPPPVEVQAWPDRRARLADREFAMDTLARWLLGPRRLTLFLACCGLLQLGWALIGVTLVGVAEIAMTEQPEYLGLLGAVLVGMLGIGVFVPAVWLTVRGLRRDRVVRERLLAWAALDRDGASDARLRLPLLSASWLLLSFAMCATGLWTSFAVPLTTGPEDGGYGAVAYGMGAALILWVAGLTGLAKAAGHYRMAIRLTGRPAARSASSEPPRPE